MAIKIGAFDIIGKQFIDQVQVMDKNTWKLCRIENQRIASVSHPQWVA
jgi:hypothetical protein